MEVLFIIKANLERRHFNQYQRDLLGLKIGEIEEERAKWRQATSEKGVYGGKPVKEKFPEAVLGQARDLAAKEVGISGRVRFKYSSGLGYHLDFEPVSDVRTLIFSQKTPLGLGHILVAGSSEKSGPALHLKKIHQD